MITAIREVRRARGWTLDDVARRCDPPTTAQTIGRLETGTRTVSVGWLNRIAAALDVESADLVRLPDRVDLPVAAILVSDGVHAPRREHTITAPRPAPGAIGITVAGSVGDYRAGDELWCETLPPDRFGAAMNRDILVPQSAGGFLFGRLVDHKGVAGDVAEGGQLHILPTGHGARPQVVADPAWIARVVRLVRAL